MSCEKSTLTGRNGKVVVENSLVARITTWSVNPKLASSSEWGDSDSAGYTNRTPGRKDATFDTEGKYDKDDEAYDLFYIGDVLTVVLWMDASTLYWDFPCALCNDFSIAVNVDSQEVIGWKAGWGADGIFYYPGQSGATSRTLPS